MGQEPWFSTLPDPASHDPWWLDRPSMVLPGYATLGTPPLPVMLARCTVRYGGYGHVLWAHNGHCVTLYGTHTDI